MLCIMKKHEWNLFAMFCIFVLMFLLSLIPTENFENYTDITYYVIHERSNQERTKNIEEQEKKLGKPIRIFDAIMGKDLDINQLSKFDEKLQNKKKGQRNNVIGCYLSHFMLVKSLLNHTEGYTVIFENDFKIVTENLDEQIQHTLKIIDKDFDLLYFGNLNDSHSQLYKENIYDIKDVITGNHAYLINNRNIQKIYNVLLTMDEAVDWKYSNSMQKNELRGFAIYPILVVQNGMESTIGY